MQIFDLQGFNRLKWWCGAGSNRRHKDFQSFALPTELPHRIKIESSKSKVENEGQFRFGMAKIGFPAEIVKKKWKKGMIQPLSA